MLSNKTITDDAGIDEGYVFNTTTIRHVLAPNGKLKKTEEGGRP